MATTYKILGQLESAATTLETLYTVPASTSAVLSSINICNRTSASKAVRIAIRQAGAVIANKQYIAYDLAIAANDSVALSLGVTLAATDIVSVYASAGSSISWNLFGSKIT
jgi:glucose-6-phosphate dehydrogenase assembly protein OpcA